MLKQSKELEAASFSLIASLPPIADVTAVGCESPKLNIPLEFGREKLKWFVRDRSSRDALE
jgi:hypothetical protein